MVLDFYLHNYSSLVFKTSPKVAHLIAATGWTCAERQWRCMPLSTVRLVIAAPIDESEPVSLVPTPSGFTHKGQTMQDIKTLGRQRSE